VKVADGGYVPLLLATVIFSMMWIWHHGSEALARRLQKSTVKVEEFEAKVIGRNTPRVPGTAVFLTRADRDVPPALLWHLELNRSLHSVIIVLTVRTASVPWIAASEHLTIKEVAPNFWRAAATFGFMEHPDIPKLLDTALGHGCTVDFTDVTYYVGHGSIVHRDDGKGLPHWQEALYAAMERNSTHVGDILRFPPERTMEIGRQIAI
jgi:KUP system potassium uptake protein